MKKGKDHVWKSKELTPGGGQLTQQRIRSRYKRKRRAHLSLILDYYYFCNLGSSAQRRFEGFVITNPRDQLGGERSHLS
jgi:hypothetical protein